MKNERRPMPEMSPESFALNSIQVGFSAADQLISSLGFGVSEKQKAALLEEMLFFHHFISFTAVFTLIRDDHSRRYFGDRMVHAITSGAPLPTFESMGLRPIQHLSPQDRDVALRRCFLSLGNMRAAMIQELYIARRPVQDELAIMNLKTVREMTGWDTKSANVPQFFAAALLARLSIALEVSPPEHLMEFLNLVACAASEATAAFRLYLSLLGAEIVGGATNDLPEPQRNERRNWFTRIFR